MIAPSNPLGVPFSSRTATHRDGDSALPTGDNFAASPSPTPLTIYSPYLLAPSQGNPKDGTTLDGRTVNPRINHEPASVDSHSKWTKDDQAHLLPLDSQGKPWTLERLAKDGPQLVRQGPLGDCYHEAVVSDCLQQDPRLLTSTTRLLGSKNGVDYYGVVFFLPSNHQAAQKFDRAGDDVTRLKDDGKSVTYTPVWVVVDDLLPAHKDGSLVTGAVTIPDLKQDVLINAIREKALATLHGKTGYRTITQGGDADKVMETMSGYPSSKLQLERSKDPINDKALADQQFKTLLAAHQAGRLTTVNTSLGDVRQVRHSLKVFPESAVQGYPSPYFDPHAFTFRDGDGDASSTAGSGQQSGNDSRAGFGWVGGHEYSLLDVSVENGVKMVKLRNPWGDVCPPEFADKGPDGKPLENGIVNIPWYLARQLLDTVKIGGRPEDEHNQDVAITYPPKHGLPRTGLEAPAA